jgi:hypothetical protein
MNDRQRQIEAYVKRMKADPESFYCEIKRAWMTKDKCLAIRNQIEPDLTCWKCEKWDERRKLRQKKEKIKYCIGKPPFGYMRCGNINLINPEEIKTLDELVKAVEKKLPEETMQSVADKLNRAGYRRRNGTEFDAMSVRNLYQTYCNNKKSKS